MAKVQKTEKKSPAAKSTSNKLPLPKRYGIQFRRLAVKVLEHRFMRAPNEAHADVEMIKAVMKAASSALVAVADKLENLPDGFRARKSAASKRKLEVGSIVEISDKRRAQYPVEILAHTGLKVTSVAGSKVVVLCPNGTSAFLPRGHLKLSAAAAA